MPYGGRSRSTSCQRLRAQSQFSTGSTLADRILKDWMGPPLAGVLNSGEEEEEEEETPNSSTLLTRLRCKSLSRA